MDVFVLVLVRWLHIGSAACLVGSLLYGGVGWWPGISPEQRAAAAARFRPIACAGVAGILVSGVYTLLIAPGHSPHYHMLLGIKILLALHVFAVAILVAVNRGRRPARAMMGAAVSGLVVIAIAAYLRMTF
jgi:hypothetical protein